LAIAGKIDEAIVEAQRALAVNPNYVPALGSMAQLERRKKNYKASLEWAQKALDISPDYYLGHFDKGKDLVNESQTCVGASLLKLGELDAALESFLICTELEPKMSEAFRLQAVIMR
jgi:tetratricopeptide (TPR) repeat protein